MKRLIQLAFLLLIACPCWATTYYLAPPTASPAGSNANSGLSAAAPWRTPTGNGTTIHCGDVLSAVASSAYVATDFVNTFPTVICPGGNDVAWIQCASIGFVCQITSGGLGMQVNNSWWGVQGWTFTGLSTCLQINANGTSATTHHVIIANNICRDSAGNGFNTNNYLVNGACTNPGPCASVGVDYQTFIGNWVYHVAYTPSDCYAAISLYEPVNSDSAAGTHIYIAGNIINDVTNVPCSAGHTYSGDAILNDTFDGEQQFLPSAYSGAEVVEDNFCLYIGGRCFDAYDSYKVSSPHSTQTVRYNTAYSVMNDPNQWNLGSSGLGAGAAFVNRDSDNNPGPAPYGGLGGDTNVTFTKNLTEMTSSTCCQGSNVSDFFVERSTNVSVTDNFSKTASGVYDTAGSNNSGVTFTSNHNGTSPGWVGPTDPGAPSCAAYATIAACYTAAGVVTDFLPSGTAVGYGHRVPVSTHYDPLFPQWLCTVTNIPTGLIQLGCPPPITGHGAGKMR